MYQTSLTKGQELVAQRMVKEFRRQGHEAYLVTSVYHDQDQVVSAEDVDVHGGYFQTFEEALGIPVIRVKSHKENWPPRRITFVDFVSNLTKIVDDLKLDVLITHSTLWNGPEETAKFVEWRRKQAKGGAPTPPLVFCHMSHFQEPSEERYELEERTFREAWNSASLPMIMRVADFVLVTTPFEKEQVSKLGVEEPRFILFPGGIDSTLLEAVPIEFRKKYGVPEGPLLLTYLGTVEERKNPKAIFAIAKQLEDRKDLHFVIAGRLEGTYGQEVRVSSVGSPNVSVVGPVPEEDYPSLIRESYANLIMSRSEALGLAQLEFMFNGVPVITSGVGGQSWIVKDGENGLVVSGPDDISGGARAVVSLADNPGRRNSMGKKATTVASQFTMPKLIHSLSKSISSVLVRGRSGTEIEPGEKVIEAWAKKGQRVAVTTRRLILDSSKGKKAVVIPLGEITGVTKGFRVSWRTLFGGTLASAVLIAVSTIDPGGSTSIGSILTSWTESLSIGIRPEMDALVYAIPFLVGLVFTLASLRAGYSISYGPSGKAFLSKEFTRALTMADELTPQDLLSGIR